MISCPQLFKQLIIYTEKATKEHNGAFWNSKSVKPLLRKMIHCFEVLQSDHVSWIIWFRSRLQSIYCNSFDIDHRLFLCPPAIKVIQQRLGWINRGGGGGGIYNYKLYILYIVIYKISRHIAWKVLRATIKTDPISILCLRWGELQRFLLACLCSVE